MEISQTQQVKQNDLPNHASERDMSKIILLSKNIPGDIEREREQISSNKMVSHDMLKLHTLYCGVQVSILSASQGTSLYRYIDTFSPPDHY